MASTFIAFLGILLIGISTLVNSEIMPWHPGQHKQQSSLNDLKNVTTTLKDAKQATAKEDVHKLRRDALPPVVPLDGSYIPGVPGVPAGGPGFPPYYPGIMGPDVGLAAAAPVFLVIEKLVVIVGGGLLILFLFVVAHAFLTKVGFLEELAFGHSSTSKAAAGSVDMDVGPLHVSKGGAGAVSFDRNGGLTQRAHDGINRQW